jgi:hypothetical protein
MLDVAPSTAVVAAGNVPAFIVADVDAAQILAALAPLTTPTRFQMLLLDLASCPEALERLKRKHASWGTMCPDLSSIDRAFRVTVVPHKRRRAKHRGAS